MTDRPSASARVSYGMLIPVLPGTGGRASVRSSRRSDRRQICTTSAVTSSSIGMLVVTMRSIAGNSSTPFGRMRAPGTIAGARAVGVEYRDEVRRRLRVMRTGRVVLVVVGTRPDDQIAGRRVWRAGLRGTAAERRKQGEQQRCSGELPCSRPGVHDLLVMGTTGSQSRSPSARHLVIMADWRHFATRTRFSAANAHGKRRSMSCLRYRPRATLVLC